MSFLLDTDACSAYLKGNHQVGSRLVQYGGRIYVSAITVAELFAWTCRAKAPPARRQSLADFIRDIVFLDVTREVSKKFGEVRARQLDQGQVTPDMDLLIAATALVHDLTLVTHNVQDFASVPGLQVVDWLAT